jgi:hypothetical protein
MVELDAALQLVEGAPSLLGEESPKRYLVLAQNNDELRATGGFISAVGVLAVDRGEIAVEWFGDSFAADDLTLIHPKAPAPLERYMWAPQWLIRDSNWFAHFPRSAATAQEMYAFDRKVKTDGVIAVDTRFLPRLVEAMGEVEWDGKPLEPNTVVSLLKENWQPVPPGEMSAAWFENDRKSFLSDLMGLLLERVKTGEVESGALAQALWHGLREKSVQIYLNEPTAERSVRKAGWGGTVEPGEGDYLFVVDSNVGFNKVNARVTRELEYAVDLTQRRPKATLKITYENPSRAAEGGCDLHKQHKDESYASMEESCYWNYVRVLTPRGSKLGKVTGASDVGIVKESEAVRAFEGYMVVPRNAAQTVEIEYELPTNPIENDTYTLKVQQQAGVAATPMRVRVSLPEGSVVRGASHAFRNLAGNAVEFQETMYSDTVFTIYLEPTKGN